MGVGFPGGGVVFGLVAPGGPAGAGAASEEFQAGAGAAAFDEGVLLVRLAAVFALLGAEVVNLGAAGGEGAGVASADAEQEHFGDVAEVEADAAAVAAAVFPQLVPDDVGFVGEAPGGEDAQALGQEGVGAPEVEVGGGGQEVGDGEVANLVECEGGVAGEAAVLGGDLAGAVGELPGGVGQDGREGFATEGSAQVGGGVGLGGGISQRFHAGHWRGPSGGVESMRPEGGGFVNVLGLFFSVGDGDLADSRFSPR